MVTTARRPLAQLFVLLLLPLLLQGCWTLEKYVARVRLEPDGGYKYFVEGTAVHAATAHALLRVERDARTGKAKGEELNKLRADAEAGLLKDLEAARKDPRVQSVTSLGGGRVRFMASGKANIGAELIFNEVNAPLTYARLHDGSLSVRLRDAVAGREAEGLKLAVEGDVTIILAQGIEVREHNAHKTPTVPGGAYRWRVEKPGEAAPHLVIRLPGQ